MASIGGADSADFAFAEQAEELEVASNCRTGNWANNEGSLHNRFCNSLTSWRKHWGLDYDLCFLTMDKIYWLSSRVGFDDQLRYSSAMRLDTELCPRCPEHAVRSRWIRPLKLIGPIEPMTDFEWTVYGDVIVSSDVAESLRKAKFSGVQFLPTEFYTSTETPFGRESVELRVNGWGGDAPAESGIHEIERCPYCKRRVFSDYTHPEKLFNIEGWDGSDFFLIWPLPRYVMVTGRVRDFILDSKYTGVRLKKLGDLPRGLAGTLTPGNVRDWFDEERLRAMEGND